ncbi:MAG: hypothetical protein LBH05_08530 [Deferribacteraceae bacterium]|jgi:hypothetical protein|nr:hypothetical protein [Deferribacteraceae bacterium]
METGMLTFIDVATKEEIEFMFNEEHEYDIEYEIEETEDIPTFCARHKDVALSNPDYNYGMLATLYANRGDIKMADYYAGKIDDIGHRQTTFMLLHECD